MATNFILLPCDIVGKDVDLVVLMTDIISPIMDIKFLKPARAQNEPQIYSSLDLQEASWSREILFIHAFTGCNSIRQLLTMNQVSKNFDGAGWLDEDTGGLLARSGSV